MEVVGVFSGFVPTVEGSAPSILGQELAVVTHLLVQQAHFQHSYLLLEQLEPYCFESRSEVERASEQGAGVVAFR